MPSRKDTALASAQPLAGFGTIGAFVHIGWLSFESAPRDPRKVTLVWKVRAREGGAVLGCVQWYAPWRRYAFSPHPGTAFEADCLGTLAQFCREQTLTRVHERRDKRLAGGAV